MCLFSKVLYVFSPSKPIYSVARPFLLTILSYHVMIRRKGKESKMAGKFYVYIWCNPSRPGKFIYERHSFLYEPLYVGKGSKNRMKSFQKAYNKSLMKERRVRSLLPHRHLVMKDNFTEKEALEEEGKVIVAIGQRNLGTGPLLNRKGGDTYFRAEANLTDIDKAWIASMVDKKKEKLSRLHPFEETIVF